jgi:predicted NBD/HSP70 family sugar kinase
MIDAEIISDAFAGLSADLDKTRESMLSLMLSLLRERDEAKRHAAACETEMKRSFALRSDAERRCAEMCDKRDELQRERDEARAALDHMKELYTSTRDRAHQMERDAAKAKDDEVARLRAALDAATNTVQVELIELIGATKAAVVSAPQAERIRIVELLRARVRGLQAANHELSAELARNPERERFEAIQKRQTMNAGAIEMLLLVAENLESDPPSSAVRKPYTKPELRELDGPDPVLVLKLEELAARLDVDDAKHVHAAIATILKETLTGGL